MKNFINNKGYKWIVILTVALVFVSFRDYFIQFSGKDKAADLFPSFLIASSMVLLYAIPTIFLISYLIKKLNISSNVVILSLIFGFTLPLYLGSLGNSLISMFLFFIKTPQQLLDSWGAALTAPFSEEIAKGIVVLLVYFLCRGISLKEAFVSGLISGFGFQVLEDWAYIFQSTFAETNSGFEIAFERVANALGSHMTFGMVFGLGLIALLKKKPAIPRWKAICFMISPVILHFIWNSPLEGDWVFLLLGSINLNLAYFAFTSVNQLDEKDNIIGVEITK